MTSQNLKALGNVVYNTNCPNGLDMEFWRIRSWKKIVFTMSVEPTKYWVYMKEEWVPHTKVWVKICPMWAKTSMRQFRVITPMSRLS